MPDTPPPPDAPTPPAAPDPPEVSRAAGRTPDPVPYDRFAEVLGTAKAAKAEAASATAARAAAEKAATEATARASAAEARVAELERKTARLGVRADLAIDDDDDADRVLTAWERAHAEVSDVSRRPKIGEWARSEAAAATLPRSLREAYGLGRAPDAAPATLARGRMPASNAGTAPTPRTAPGADPFATATPDQIREALKGARLR